MYGRREKKGREAGFPRLREAGEKEKNYAIFCNRKNAKRRELTNTGRETGLTFSDVNNNAEFVRLTG